MMLLVLIWTIGNALEMAGADLPTKIFWANLEYLGYSGVPLACLALALEYAGYGHWLTYRRLAGLAIIPLLTQAAVWTNPWHGLMRRNVYLDTSGPFPVIGKDYGPWATVHHVSSYAFMFVALALLAHAAWRASRHHRPQILALLIGLALPLLSSLSYVLRLNPIRRLDLTPAMFNVMGVVLTWGVFRWRLFDIVPVARSMVIEGMVDGLIIFDRQGRAVDLNPAAERLLGWPATKAIGRPIAGLLQPWPALADLCSRGDSSSVEIMADGRSYDARFLSLADRRGRALGRLLILHDISERKHAEARLLAQQRALAALQERERLARELHDGLGQVLGYLNVQAQAIREQLARGQVADAEQALARLATIAQEAHADVRAYIHDARPARVGAGGLTVVLAEHLRRFSRHYGLATELIGTETLEDGALEPAAEEELLCIVQEALSNVREHAAATRVRVALAAQGCQLQVDIEDDGCGFDPQVAGLAGGYGLQIMHERAAEAGGSLQLVSALGRGTHVIVRLPWHRKDYRGHESAPG